MKRALIQVRKEKLQLLPDKAMYWPSQRTLMIADLHLGKAMHFRKAGIPVPNGVDELNLQRLNGLLVLARPKEVLLLGDLFHSGHNSSWSAFVALRHQHRSTAFTLVSGNHDVLSAEHYALAEMEVVPFVDHGPFHFTHHPTEHAIRYNLAGHIHPSIQLIGKAKQTVQLPCFYFGRSGGVLPAFGGFTGLYRMPRMIGDRVFATAQGQVWRV